MDEGSLGLKQSPGLGIATLERYVPLETRESIVREISKTIQRGLGPCTVIGGIGSGKSLLAQRIAQRLHPDFSLVLLHGSTLRSAGKLYECLMSELDIDVRSTSNPGVRAAVQEFLLNEPSSDGAGLLILVDDAHWCSGRVFEELLLMGDWTDGRTPRVRYVLLGTPHLEHVLLQPRLQSLHHRIAHRSYLPFYRAEESRDVILTKIRMSGGDALQLLSEEALRSIHRLTQGNPRWLDYLLDFSLRLAIEEPHRRIEPPLVERAWADLQGLQQADGDAISQNVAAESKSGEWIEFIEMSQSDSEVASRAVDREQPAVATLPNSEPIFDRNPPLPDVSQNSPASTEGSEGGIMAMAAVESIPTSELPSQPPESREIRTVAMASERGYEFHPSGLPRFLTAWRRQARPKDAVQPSQVADDRFRILEIPSSETR
jgi:type II secretory pathway predicted ATPase ExeA